MHERDIDDDAIIANQPIAEPPVPIGAAVGDRVIERIEPRLRNRLNMRRHIASSMLDQDRRKPAHAQFARSLLATDSLALGSPGSCSSPSSSFCRVRSTIACASSAPE